MKLVNKFLTALAPVAMVGVITPTLVACNKGSSYTIHYGQDINCLNAKEKNYHSVSTIASAVKSKVNREPKDSEITLQEIKDTLKTDSGIQNVYYDLIANYSSIQHVGFKLSGWDVSADSKFTFDWVDNDHQIEEHFTSATVDYIKSSDGENRVLLEIRDSSQTITCVSYTYQDVILNN